MANSLLPCEHVQKKSTIQLNSELVLTNILNRHTFTRDKATKTKWIEKVNDKKAKLCIYADCKHNRVSTHLHASLRTWTHDMSVAFDSDRNWSKTKTKMQPKAPKYTTKQPSSSNLKVWTFSNAKGERIGPWSQKHAPARTSRAPHWQAIFKSFLWVGCETPDSSDFSIWVPAVIVISQAFVRPRGGRVVAMSMWWLRRPFLTHTTTFCSSLASSVTVPAAASQCFIAIDHGDCGCLRGQSGKGCLACVAFQFLLLQSVSEKGTYCRNIHGYSK